MNKTRIGIVFGGRSGEHEVSIISAKSVVNALNKKKYEVVPLFINKEGKWLLGFDRKLLKGRGAKQVYLPLDPTKKELVLVEKSEISTKKIDVVFPLLHGTYGEDGAVQGLLELSGLPYVGAGVVASAVGMDKVLMKRIFKSVGLPITKYLAILRKQVENKLEDVVGEVERKMAYPIFVKPANLGSSVGITKAHNRKELTNGLATAGEYDRNLIIEQGVDKAREIEVAVLGNDDPKASICGEVIPSKEFYDYEDKYILGKAKLQIPALIPKKLSSKIRKMAIKAFQAIDCSGMARADFLIDPKSGEVYIDEINTIPGFTSISMYPKLWEASGISYKDLIDRLINLAIERLDDKKRSKTSYPSKLLT